MKRYRVYRNLTNGLISIRDIKSGLVIGHAEEVILADSKFIVSESGRKRVLRENQKNVHAFVEGYIVDIKGFLDFKSRLSSIELINDNPTDNDDSVDVTYNPYRFETFVAIDDNRCIKTAKRVIVDNNGNIKTYGANL